MNGINANPASLLFTPLPGQAAAGAPPRATAGGPTLLAPSLAQLPTTSAAELKLPAPPSDALAPAVVDAAIQRFTGLQAREVAVDLDSCRALLLQCAQETRNGARAERHAMFSAQVASMQAEAQEMRNAAAARFTGAMVQGSLQIAGGAASLGLNLKSAAESVRGIKLDTAGNEAGGKLAATDAFKYKGAAEASSSLTGGLGAMIGAGFTLKAEHAEARRTEQATRTKVLESGVQEAHDLMQQAQDNINALKEMARSLDQSNTDANRSIARNI